jgi:hypothetical protein
MKATLPWLCDRRGGGGGGGGGGCGGTGVRVLVRDGSVELNKTGEQAGPFLMQRTRPRFLLPRLGQNQHE